MMSEPVRIISREVCDGLFRDVEQNLDLYLKDGFSGQSQKNGWLIELPDLRWDPSFCSALVPAKGLEAECKNSLLVYRAFPGLTPALAREERLWVRLCHLDCLNYCRGRWILEKDPVKSIKRHLFAGNLGGCRDDNAVARLWWQSHVAHFGMPDDPERGLELLLSRANIRMQVLERAENSFRRPLVQGIFRMLRDHYDWFDQHDEAILHFMKEVNKRSGYRVFEVMKPEDIDEHLEFCLEEAEKHPEFMEIIAVPAGG